MIEVIIMQCYTETRVEVANCGSSIRPKERERISDRFYRGIEASHGPSGTGLGLSIVKKTAEAHGGRAWVECDEDTTRFFFVLENTVAAHFDGAKHGLYAGFRLARGG
jgi:signal transduction histidine kinase